MGQFRERILNAALRYAQIGWPVFPLVPKGKTPITKHGCHDASVNENQIRQWWENNPDANIGIATGKSSGLFVIDVDVKKGKDGSKSYKELENEFDFPLTKSVITPSGGRHFIFGMNGTEFTIAEGIREGIDIRATGGYIVASPSYVVERDDRTGEIKYEGRYQWDEGSKDVEIEDIPPDFIEYLYRKKKKPLKIDWGEGIIDGGRDDTIFRLACSMRAQGFRKESILLVVREANKSCKDKSGRHAPLSEDLLLQKVESACKYPPGKPNKSPQAGIDNDLHPAKEKDTDKSLKIKLTPKIDLANKMTSTKWLVKDFLEQDSFGVLFGESQAYKSFAVLDFGMSVATGISWHGHKVSQGNVVYICGEGHAGIGRRLSAWEIHHERPHNAPASLVATNGALDLLSPEVCIALKSSIDEIFEDPPVLIIIDTLARNFGAGNENATSDMNTFINNVNAFIRSPYGCCVLTTHHVGHLEKDRARGAYALYAATDFEYKATRFEDSIILENTKMKDGPSPDRTMLDSVSVELPIATEEGRPLSSLALRLSENKPPSDLSSPEQSYKNLGKLQKRAIEELEKCFEDMSSNLRASGRKPLDFIILDEWKARCDMNRYRFRDVKAGLTERSIIRIKDGFVYKGQNW